MSRMLLIDFDADHARRLVERFRTKNWGAEWVGDIEGAVRLLRSGAQYDLMLLDVSPHRVDWASIVRQLQHASIQPDHPFWCRILCISRTPKPAEFVLTIESLGCRYAFEG